MRRLTVIIPIYNTAFYLSRCISSVLAQTNIADIEIIAINDGSTDNSLDVINEYRANFPEVIKVINIPNSGVSYARNVGVSNVRTDYFCFLDSDDWVEPKLYEQSVMLMEKKGYDFICFDYVEHWPTQKRRVSARGKIERSKYYLGSVLCNKLFSTKFWQRNTFLFTAGIRFEDIEMAAKIYAATDNFGLILDSDCFYNYDRSNGASFTNQRRDTKSLLQVFKNLIDFYYQQNDPYLLRFIATTFFFQLVLFGGNPNISMAIYKEYRWLFLRGNIDSRYSRMILLIQKFNLDFLIAIPVYLVQWLRINPHKI